MSRHPKAVKRAIWLAVIAGIAGALYVRATGGYASDSPVGVACGAGTFVLIALSTVSGRLRRGSSAVCRFARQAHWPLASLALAAALAHWHIRWRDFAGVSTSLLFIMVFVTSGLGLTRRYRSLRLIHKYGGYALLILAPFHGIRALFFAGN